jgi:formylglycine-generating enzyme required for sulfatase activity
LPAGGRAQGVFWSCEKFNWIESGASMAYVNPKESSSWFWVMAILLVMGGLLFVGRQDDPKGKPDRQSKSASKPLLSTLAQADESTPQTTNKPALTPQPPAKPGPTTTTTSTTDPALLSTLIADAQSRSDASQQKADNDRRQLELFKACERAILERPALAARISQLEAQVSTVEEARNRTQQILNGLYRGSLSISLGDGVRPLEFVWVPHGRYRVGRTAAEADEAYRDAVQQAAGTESVREWATPDREGFAFGYFIGRFEVTAAQFARVRGNRSNPVAAADADLPATKLSWLDARDFCERISRELGWEVRLPTEVEWEYAARGSQGFRFGTQDGKSPQLLSASFTNLMSVDKLENDKSWCGAIGMSGNVSEWCLDVWRDKLSSDRADQPHDPLSESVRMMSRSSGGITNRTYRGGSYDDSAVNWEAATRRRQLEQNPSDRIGFRVVLVPRMETLFDSGTGKKADPAGRPATESPSRR